jgi:Arc-like DNA binding dprotein
MPMEPKAPNVHVRLNEAFRQQLIAEAKRSERSLNGEIVYRLRRSIETQPQPDED